MHKGIDVSGFQGFPDFHAVARAGYRFVYIKSSEGATFVDSGYQRRQRDARHAGLHTGFYHFLRPRADRRGSVEAEHFWNTVNGIQAGKGQGARLLRLAADIEVTTMSPAATRDYSHSFMRRLGELADHRPILYTFPAFLDFWDPPLTHHDLWIANFGVSKPRLPRGFSKWTIWQHSSNGFLPERVNFGTEDNEDEGVGFMGKYYYEDPSERGSVATVQARTATDLNRAPKLKPLMLERNSY